MDSELENNDVIEVYQRLSLLLEQQNKTHSEEKNEETVKGDFENSEIIENNINILTNLLLMSSQKKDSHKENKHKSFQVESTNLSRWDSKRPHKSLQFGQIITPPLKESVDYNGSQDSFINYPKNNKINKEEELEKTYTYNSVLPHMDELVTVLTKQKLVANDNELQNNENSKEKEHTPQSNGQEKQKNKKSFVQSYKKTKYDAFAIYKVFLTKLRN